MTAVQTLSPAVSLSAIPAIQELAQRDQWVVWKYVTRKGKQDKPPFNPRTGTMASHSDPRQWASFAEALAARPQYTGIGFVFTVNDPYTGIDIDDCIVDGRLHPEAERIIRSLDSYSEISPSGSGVKVWVRGQVRGSIGKTRIAGLPFSIEVYTKQRYFTVTGRHLLGTPHEIREAACALAALYQDLRPEPPAPSRPPTLVRSPSAVSATGERAPVKHVIAGLNRDHDLGELLERYGATLVRTVGDARYYGGLSGDQHQHRVTYIVSPARDGRGQIGYSYSPNGRLNNVAFPHGFRWFDAVCALDYAGDVRAALKTLNPLTGGPKAAMSRAALTPATSDEHTPTAAARRQDRERKRTARRAIAAHIRESVALRAHQDTELSDRAQRILQALLDLAGERAWCRPRVARLAAIVGICERSAHTGLRELEAGQYIASGHRLGPHQTTVRTFLCLHDPQDERAAAVCRADISSHESAERLDSTAWQRGVEPRTATPQQPAPDPDLVSYVRALAREVNEADWYLSDDAAWTAQALTAEAARLERLIDQAAAQPVRPDSAPAVAEGASYDPARSILVADAPYSETRGLLSPKDLYTIRRRPAQERWPERTVPASQSLAQATLADDGAGAGAPAEDGARLHPPPPRAGITSAYRQRVQEMSDRALASELRKHRATLAKYPGALWLNQVQAKIRLVELEIDTRDQAARLMGVPLTDDSPCSCAPRPSQTGLPGSAAPRWPGTCRAQRQSIHAGWRTAGVPP